jgi:hypothetical protein
MKTLELPVLAVKVQGQAARDNFLSKTRGAQKIIKVNPWGFILKPANINQLNSCETL